MAGRGGRGVIYISYGGRKPKISTNNDKAVPSSGFSDLRTVVRTTVASIGTT